ncbi:hypothetical protein K5X82_03260 [Halosquirtibacter xylanolyticus]|uniref:hypothetical protein n=1 Tax=Halosquirtibacter xylanolyticus TaxID=3374599 RepID=UPI003749B338|nr:hypothetical protein K5X82_03260 [Prolixibacteraceae bacterium]
MLKEFIKQTVNLSDPSSIKKALNYFYQLTKDRAFKLGECDKYPSLFVNDHGVPFHYEDIENRPRMQLVMNMGEYSFNHETPRFDYIRFSETILFEAAVKYPELKALVVTIAKEIVALSVELNNTSDLWIDEYHTFGLHILFTLALNDNQYIYLIAQYIIPYWDDEHAENSFQQLQYFVGELGYSNPYVLKAIANCYNDNQVHLLAFQEDYEAEMETSLLWEHCKANPKDFKLLMKEFIQHIKSTPPHMNELGGTTRLGDWYIENLFGFYPGDEKGNTPCGETTFESLFWGFSKEVDQVMSQFSKKDLFFRDRHNDEEEIMHDYENDIDNQNREFLLKGFDNGEDMLRYVETGANPEVLQTIEPSSLLQFCKRKNLSLYSRVEYYGSEFDEMIHLFFETYYNEDAHIEGMQYLVNGEDPSGISQCLRLLDVIFHLNGCRAYNEYVIHSVCNEYKMLSHADFDKRYIRITDYKSYLQNLVAYINPIHADALPTENLERIYRLYKHSEEPWLRILHDLRHTNRTDIDNEILRSAFDYENDVTQPTATELISIAYICMKEGGLSAPEELRPLISYFKDNFWKVFDKAMLEEGFKSYDIERSEKDRLIEMIHSHCEGPKMPPPPPREIMIKLMKGGPESLNPEEKEIFETLRREAKNQSKPVSDSVIFELYKSVAAGKKEGQKQLHISVFKRDNFGLLLATCLYSYDAFPGAMSSVYIRLLHLFISLAPVKAIHEIFKSFVSSRYFHRDYTSLDIVEFIDKLEKVKVPKSYITAWEIYENKHALSQDEEDRSTAYATYMSHVNDYAYADSFEETSSFALSFEKSRKKAVKLALDYLDADTIELFLENVNQVNPSEEYLQLKGDKFEQALIEFTRRIINYETPDWARSDEKKEAVAKELASFKQMIKDYLYEDESFDIIEENILPRVHDYIPSTIDDVIWDESEVLRHRALYMFGRMGYMNRLDDYYRTWERQSDEEVIDDFCSLLEELGFETSFVVKFLTHYHHKAAQNDWSEDCEYGKQLMDLYESLDFTVDFKEITASELSFLLTHMRDKVELTPKLLVLFNNQNQKIQWDAASCIAHNLEERYKYFSPEIKEFVATGDSQIVALMKRVIAEASPFESKEEIEQLLS